ncbi:preprotein translocase subunit SecY [Lyngbya confervoides]|uniref:Protein translocase subunit SecY n=1 Tax=Lyngbya confervoides BDU141951 TaxID=1574623 RepID=A0ABD4T949_9CYAN|nr:preprotein translocase subunit SecY [Lyngbya confervoides]MCM1985322.1 preprotein translocase subunit SecY [Lyngbya confervoides BDU141951]
MVVSRGKAPSAQETFAQMAQAAGLRGRIFITIGLLILVRFGIYLPVPGINREAFATVIADNQVFGFLDFLSGRGFSALGIFALGILPFINASIIMQLLTAALPSLERLQKDEGEAGRRKIAQITRYVALGWAILQSTGFALFVNSAPGVADNPGPFFIVQMVVALTAGAMFVTWVGEIITERGVGNGASLLIFLGIVSVLPRSITQTIDFAQGGGSIGSVIILLAVFLVMIVGIVFVQEGTRRIPIVYAKRQVGRRMYREQTSYLPLRLNQGGVMPIIFASSVLILPLTIGANFQNPTVQRITNYLSPNGPTPWVYAAFYLSMIVFFSYFYASLIINPVDLSQNLKKMGASIPGIRPGKATSQYIERVLNRLTLLGAVFLGAVAIVPTVVENATRVTTFQGLGATSLLILVGVAIDTAKQIQTYVISQRYEGMVKQD